MSSYLHRLAASARRTTSPLRPIVGSLYSAPKGMSEPQTEAIHEEAAQAPLRRFREESQTIDSVIRGEARPLLSNLPAENSVSERPEIGKGSSVADSFPHSHFTPLLSDLRLAETRNPLDIRGSHESQTESPFDRTAADSDSAPMELSNSPARRFELLHERILQPLISPDARFNPPPQARPILPAAANERMAVQSDQIEIHIGRIEVTAVPAPAVPTPVPPARRSRSLDLSEYLKRGDGRAL